jgi:hypothetical protein
MATADQLGTWILANKDKKGTPEFAKVVQGYAAIRNSQTPDEATPPPAPVPAQPEAPPATAMQELGMGTRDVIEGLATVPAMLYDLAAYPLNQGPVGNSIYSTARSANIPSGASQVRRGLTALGLPESRNNLASAIVRGGASALTPMGAAGLYKPASMLGTGIKNTLIAQPAAQIVSGGTSAGSSELAREAGFGPVGQTVAGLAGGLGGGLAASARKPKPASLRDAAEGVETEAKAFFRDSEAQGLAVSDSSYKSFATKLRATIENEGLDKDLTPSSNAALNRISAEIDTGPMTLEKINTLRKVIGAAGGSTAPADRRLASKMKEGLDDYLDNLDPNADIIAGNASAVDSLKTARKLWTRLSKAEKIESLINRADLSDSDKATAIQQEFRTLAKNPKKMRQFTPEEQFQINKIVKGGLGMKILEALGTFAPTDLRGVGQVTAAGMGGGATGAAAAAAGGMAAKFAAGKLAAKQAREAFELMLNGAPTRAPQRSVPGGLGAVTGTISNSEQDQLGR